jgi:hypothetical protein
VFCFERYIILPQLAHTHDERQPLVLTETPILFQTFAMMIYSKKDKMQRRGI